MLCAKLQPEQCALLRGTFPFRQRRTCLAVFDAPIPAELARRFGSALLTEGAKSVNLKDFKTYDRMLPTQEHLPMVVLAT